MRCAKQGYEKALLEELKALVKLGSLPSVQRVFQFNGASQQYEILSSRGRSNFLEMYAICCNIKLYYVTDGVWSYIEGRTSKPVQDR